MLPRGKRRASATTFSNFPPQRTLISLLFWIFDPLLTNPAGSMDQLSANLMPKTGFALIKGEQVTSIITSKAGQLGISIA